MPCNCQKDPRGWDGIVPGLKDLIGSMVGPTGVILIVSQTRSIDGAGHLWPAVAILFATFAWSIGTLVQRSAVKPGQVLWQTRMPAARPAPAA